MKVFYKPNHKCPLPQFLGFVQPKEVMNLPLKAVTYTTYEVFLSVADYKPSSHPYIWKNVRDQTHNTNPSLLECHSENTENPSKFFMKVCKCICFNIENIRTSIGFKKNFFFKRKFFFQLEYMYIHIVDDILLKF